MRRAMLGLGLTLLLLAACRAPFATGEEQTRAEMAMAPVPYTAAVVPQTAATPQTDANQRLSDAELLDLGAALYATNCAPCHQPNGEGNLDTFPALNRNAFVTLSAPEPVIDTVLHGRAIMPAFAPTLNDVEVAATISYIRNAWSNDASLVSPEQVGEVRTAEAEQPDGTGRQWP